MVTDLAARVYKSPPLPPIRLRLLTLKSRVTSRNLRFSVGMNPAKKILIPSRTLDGMVTTPYADGVPYRQQMKSDK